MGTHEGQQLAHWCQQRLLYSLKQAGRQWKLKLDRAMKKLRFTSSSADECLYTKQTRGRVDVLVLVYMDNMAIAAPHVQGDVV